MLRLKSLGWGNPADRRRVRVQPDDSQTLRRGGRLDRLLDVQAGEGMAADTALIILPQTRSTDYFGPLVLAASDNSEELSLASRCAQKSRRHSSDWRSMHPRSSAEGCLAAAKKRKYPNPVDRCRILRVRQLPPC